VRGDLSSVAAPLVRVHLTDTLRDLLAFHSDSRRWTLRAALERVAKEGAGVVVVLRETETPRELADAIMGIKAATPAATPAAPVLRTYGIGAQILQDLGISRMRVLSAPKQLHGLSAFDLEVESYVDREP
jgi:3,4-dihydroxy 2-butanone 4-phosphate synthase/GTP cyclohydrolase II